MLVIYHTEVCISSFLLHLFSQFSSRGVSCIYQGLMIILGKDIM